MAIAKMKKVYLIAHQAEKDNVLAILQQVGVLEVGDLQSKDAENEVWAEMVESDQEQEALQDLESRLSEVRFSLDFLHRYYPAKKSLMDSLGSAKASIAVDEFSGKAAKWAQISDDVYKALRKVDEKLMSLRNEETRLHNLKLQLAPWAKLTAPLEEIKTSLAVQFELGVLPSAELGRCREALISLAPEGYLEEVNVTSGEAFVFLAYAKESAEAVQAMLKQHNYNKQVFPPLTGTPAENLAKIEKDLVEASKQREEALAGAGKQVEHRESMNFYYDYLVMERDKKQVVGNFARTGNSFIVEGWIREEDLPELDKRLSAACDTVEVVSRNPLEGEFFPVALENKKTFAPFEFITQLYGTPSPHGLDPTPALTPFFIVFFGLCMTDAGYGVVIALLAALGLWKLKLGDTGRKLMWVLLAGGLSTIVFGMLVGGVFGAEILGAPYLFSALVDPIRMLIYALALGVIQIFYGMAIKAWWSIREGKILDAIFDQGMWYLLIIGLILLGAVPDFAQVGKVMSIAGAAGLVLTQGRTQPTIIKKLLSGVLSLYDITGYLSDVLSYSRLLALGLATGVIALAINTMAGLLAGSVVGFIVMVIILIGGHTFNLVINTLGSYIHSSRLQYIEFYNRFYEGGGRTFVPFRLNTRHVEVQPKWQENK